MKPFPNLWGSHPATQISTEFSTWLRTDGASLVASAELLGGPDCATRAQKVMDDLLAGMPAAARLADLRALLRSLTLEFVDDLFSVEAASFAAILPDDPRADRARLCAETLERVVTAFGDATTSPHKEAA
jgi:hypothetical protein